MRSMPLILGFLLGLAAAAFTGCPAPACTAANCALGCCDASGRCQTSSSSTCGTRGAVCSTCRIDESCVSGSCMSSGSGAGASGGGTSGTGGGTASGSYPAFLDSLSNAYCAKLIECGQLPAGTQADCTSVFRPYLARGAGSGTGFGLATERGVRIGASTFDAMKAQACLAEIGRATCSNMSPQGDVSSCSVVTAPAAASNAVCNSNFDCSVRGDICSGQVCQRRCSPGGRLDEPCRTTGAACDAPLVCLDNLCATEPAPGTPCSFSRECGPNNQCRGGVCERLPLAGQPCPNFVCAPTAYCEVSTRVCRDKKAIGTTCSSGSECVATAFCRTVCTARGTPGAACRLDSECVDTTSCFEGACRTFGAAGARCIDSQDCVEGLSCDSVVRTCQAYSSTVPTGQPCTSTQNCAAVNDRCRNAVVLTDGGVGVRGTCGAPVVGDRCSGNFDCSVSQYCDVATMTCQSAGPSTPCSTSSNCRSTDSCVGRTCAPKVTTGQPCMESSACAVATDRCLFEGDGGGRCGPYPGLNQPCSTTCAFPYSCVNGTCATAGRIGETCSPNTPSGCTAGACVRPDGGVGYSPESRCSPALANGAPCESDVGCQSGHCDFLARPTPVCAAACN